MASEAWRSNDKSEGYSNLLWNKPNFLPLLATCQLKSWRPWHSKIQLPIEANTDRDADFCHLESHDLDCLLVVLRTLMSLEFCPEPKYRRSAIIICALHNFGWERRADYKVKGMLVAKLFPDDLDDMDALRCKLTFEKLLKHPGVDKVVFGHPEFGLKDPRLFISDPAPELSAQAESIIESSYEDMTKESEVTWDGVKSLGQTVADQSCDLDLMAENRTKISRRFCAVPKFVRVLFTPDESHPRGFDDVRRFQLITPTIRHTDDGMAEEIMSDSTYLLCAVVRINPEDPVGNQAEVRTYGVHARMVLPPLRSKNDQRDVAEQKIKRDSKWKVGDPKFKFMLFYCRWDPPSERVRSPIPSEEPPAEYRSPPPVYHFYEPWLFQNRPSA